MPKIFKMLTFFSLTMTLMLTQITNVSANEVEVVETELGADFTHHIEIIAKTLDGQDLPYLSKVELTITDPDTGETTDLMLHPMFSRFFHYGANAVLESNKIYKLAFVLHPPTFVRDPSTKDRWLEHVSIEAELDTSSDFSNGVIIKEVQSDEMNASVMVANGKSMFEAMFDDGEHMMHEVEDGESSQDINLNNVIVGLGLALFGFVIGIFIGRRRVVRS